MEKTHVKQLLLPFILSLFMGVLLWNIGYNTPRPNFNFFILQYLLLFIFFYILWLNRSNLGFKAFLIIAILLRLVLLVATPELSNDFYRFIWDGELLARGINPFSATPDELLTNPGFYNNEYLQQINLRFLYHGMGELSQTHYSCYPVLNQILFYIPARLTDSIFYNLLMLRIIVILADIGAIFYARKIALHLKIPVQNIWLYGLNPFIILEFTGNLHFEGVMIFFLLAGLYYILKNNWIFGAIFFACAIQIKLIPIMLIPFVFKKLKWRNSLGFVALTSFIVLLIGGIMLNQQYFSNMMLSINEYFIRFQFNGSVSSMISSLGFWLNGWDPILLSGPILSYISAAGILTLALLKAFRNDLDIFKGMLFALMIYYSLATTVHPWYISLILVLSIFTQYKFGIIWSLLIMLTYSAYSDPSGFKENPIFIVAEYALVYIVLFYEIKKQWRSSSDENKESPIGMQLKSFFGKK